MSLADYWYVLCPSEALQARPLASWLRGSPLVLFRAQGREPVALLDRCPHRNVPLSLGVVQDHTLACGYHGWRFDREGKCVEVPGRCGAALPKAQATRFATREQDGYVWCWGRPDAEPRSEPYRLEALPLGHTVLRRSFVYRAGLHASLENTIDVPHTAFLHRGLFRSVQARQRISCTVTREGSEVRAEYAGESRPDTWLARVLAPGGGTLEHEDRFILPSIVRVEYRLGDQARLLSSALFTPLDADRTQLHVQIAYRLGRVPGAWLAPLLHLVSTRVLREDAEILAQQSENLARFAGPDFASTELDLFSSQIAELLERAEAGKLDDDVHQRRIELMI
jgi:phenylpropionate dioxygenase-like ring-hydroxylating dioxygenase large terminal subunit